MSNPENSVSRAIDLITKGSPNMKETTKNTYKRMLRKMFATLRDMGKDMRDTAGLPLCIHKCDDILNELENGAKWGMGLKPSSKKNYMSLLLSLTKHLEDPLPYKGYRKAFDVIKSANNAIQELQLPADNDLCLKDLKLEDLKKDLNYHFKKVRKTDSIDIESALLNMLGHLHIDQVLRNEAHNMLLTSNYLSEEDYKDTNFIWLKGRNEKLMVIRNNKVRNPERGDPAKEVILKGEVNTAINKYKQVLTNKYGTLQDTIPLVDNKHLTEGKTVSNSHYSQVFKKIWKHKDYNITTTQLRKIYAMDVRDKYKGNLIKEKEACEKLDHSADTHNKHYILSFD